MWLSSFLLFTDIWAQHSFFTFFSDQSQVYHLGSNYNNRRGDLDTAIKKVSPVEQSTGEIYQSWHVWIHSWRVNVKCKFEMKKLDLWKCCQWFPSTIIWQNHAVLFGAQATTAQSYPGRDTFEFDQGHVTKNQPIIELVLLRESLST